MCSDYHCAPLVDVEAFLIGGGCRHWYVHFQLLPWDWCDLFEIQAEAKKSYGVSLIIFSSFLLCILLFI